MSFWIAEEATETLGESEKEQQGLQDLKDIFMFRGDGAKSLFQTALNFCINEEEGSEHDLLISKWDRNKWYFGSCVYF